MLDPGRLSIHQVTLLQQCTTPQFVAALRAQRRSVHEPVAGQDAGVRRRRDGAARRRPRHRPVRLLLCRPRHVAGPRRSRQRPRRGPPRARRGGSGWRALPRLRGRRRRSARQEHCRCTRARARGHSRSRAPCAQGRGQARARAAASDDLRHALGALHREARQPVVRPAGRRGHRRYRRRHLRGMVGSGDRSRDRAGRQAHLLVPRERLAPRHAGPAARPRHDGRRRNRPAGAAEDGRSGRLRGLRRGRDLFAAQLVAARSRRGDRRDQGPGPAAV